MAVAVCPRMDPTPMAGPVSPGVAGIGPQAAPGAQGQAGFLEAFGLAIDAAAQTERQPATSKHSGARLAALSQVAETQSAVPGQIPPAAVPGHSPVADAAQDEAFAPEKQTAYQEQTPAAASPVFIAPVLGGLTAVPAQTCLGSPPDFPPAPDAADGAGLPPATEAVDDVQSRIPAGRASGETVSDRQRGSGQTQPPGISRPYVHDFPAGQSPVPNPERQAVPCEQARPGDADYARASLQSSGLAFESSARAEAVREAGPPVSSDVPSAVADCCPGDGNPPRQVRDFEALARNPTEAPAPELPRQAAGTDTNVGRETAGSIQTSGSQPEAPPSAEARINSGRTLPDRDPQPQLSAEVRTAMEAPTARNFIAWVAATGVLKECAGLKEVAQNPGRSGFPPLEDRLPVALRSGEAWTGLFRPVLPIESAPHATVSTSPDVRAAVKGVQTQADATPQAPAASRPDQASDAFVRATAGTPQETVPDAAFQTPVASPPGRGPGFYSFVPELAGPASGHSPFTDGAVSGNAGAAQHLSLQGRPVEAPAVTQPSASLVFASSDDLYLRLAEQMHLQVRDGKSSVRIQLKPDALGRLEIKAESTAAGLTATIVAETHGVKAFLEQNLHTLYRTLQDMGLKVDRILVTEDGSPHHAPGHSNDGDARPGENRSYGDRSPSWQPEDPAERAEPLPVAAVPGYWMPHSTFHAVA